MKKLNKKGFTLVELIVVIVIIGVLALIAVPVFSRYIGRANDAVDQAEARNVYLAAQVHVADAERTGALTGDILAAHGAAIAEIAGVPVANITAISVADGAVTITYNGVTMPNP